MHVKACGLKLYLSPKNNFLEFFMIEKGHHGDLSSSNYCSPNELNKFNSYYQSYS